MNELDYELIAIVNGWFKLRLGWYHSFAQAYVGYDLAPLCFISAEEAVKYQITTFMQQ